MKAVTSAIIREEKNPAEKISDLNANYMTLH